MAVKLLLCLAIVLIGCSENFAKRRYEHLKEFEKYSPYPWTQWLRFHPSAGAYAAVGDWHRTPPPVLIPPVDPARFSTSQEDDDDDIEDDDDGIGFSSFFKRGASDPSLAKSLNITFWKDVTLPLPPGYFAAQKSLFLSKLFDALAKAVINSTAAVGTAPSASVSTTSATPNDKDEDVLVSEIERSVEGSESEESEESSKTESPEGSTTAAATTLSTLEKKLDFLERLNAIISTTQSPEPISTKKPKLKSKLKAKKTKKVKGKAFITKPTTTTPTPVPRPAPLSYEDVAKMILDVDE